MFRRGFFLFYNVDVKRKNINDPETNDEKQFRFMPQCRILYAQSQHEYCLSYFSFPVFFFLHFVTFFLCFCILYTIGNTIMKWCRITFILRCALIESEPSIECHTLHLEFLQRHFYPLNIDSSMKLQQTMHFHNRFFHFLMLQDSTIGLTKQKRCYCFLVWSNHLLIKCSYWNQLYFVIASS